MYALPETSREQFINQLNQTFKTKIKPHEIILIGYNILLTVKKKDSQLSGVQKQ